MRDTEAAQNLASSITFAPSERQVKSVAEALATARREGAQEMRERCVTVASNETEYAARANMVERYSGCYDVTAKIRSLPLEKEKS